MYKTVVLLLVLAVTFSGSGGVVYSFTIARWSSAKNEPYCGSHQQTRRRRYYIHQSTMTIRWGSALFAGDDVVQEERVID